MDLVIQGIEGLVHVDHVCDQLGAICESGRPRRGGDGEEAALPELMKLSALRGKARELDLRVGLDAVYEPRIGAGAFGTVKRGPPVNSHVAVKFLANGNSHSLRTMQAELEAFANCAPHDNVVHCYGANLDPNNRWGAIYLVEELMERSLTDVIYDRLFMETCTYSTLLNVFLDVAKGAGHLHSSGVTHCDLKPDNILLDASNRAKVCDLGLAKVATNSTGDSVPNGTPRYMAHELLLSFYFDGRVVHGEEIDVYSFGVVMWEAITGRTPPGPLCGAETDTASKSLALQSGDGCEGVLCTDMANANKRKYPLRDSCPAELKELVWDCTSYDWEKRPNFVEVTERLQGFLNTDWASERVRSPV